MASVNYLINSFSLKPQINKIVLQQSFFWEYWPANMEIKPTNVTAITIKFQMYMIF